jgi:hypothetical protein
MRDIIIAVIFGAFFLGAVTLYQGDNTTLAILSLVGAFISLFFALVNRQEN